MKEYITDRALIHICGFHPSCRRRKTENSSRPAHWISEKLVEGKWEDGCAEFPLLSHLQQPRGYRDVGPAHRYKPKNGLICVRDTIVAASTKTAPCSNIPLRCLLCPPNHPAIWKYTARHHFLNRHPAAELNQWKHLWQISSTEKAAMDKVWDERRKVPMPWGKNKHKKDELGALIISEATPCPARIEVAKQSGMALQCMWHKTREALTYVGTNDAGYSNKYQSSTLARDDPRDKSNENNGW
ncbi:hypothetical protein ARMSODRAFT_1040015 [Armillaria solidipes]|uniref:Uncharacterized protein n=1 Tax=Armillaria solidipes TaxID=1076256 RepID=A0A2H3BFK3_9AGAR|nr:hypothetical protein ARMSODRAFT_1040015 [Armillaria solidipes]